MKKFFAMVFAMLLITVTASAEVQINRGELIQRALDVQKNAYAPYSKFHVGAAVLCGSGKIYTGVNVENASYPAGISAVTLAVFNAAAQGERQIIAVATVGGVNGVNGVNKNFCPPCGTCLQVMREFANPKELLIIVAKSPSEYVEKTLEEFLPLSFDPANLK